MAILLYAAALLVTQYAFSYLLIFRNYRQTERYEASSCTISMAHGPLVTVIAAYDVAVLNRRPDAPNTLLQNAVMEYSIAYFIVDLLHYLLFVHGSGKFLFVAHHVATALVMASCRYYACHGATSLMALLVVAEITSACQNTWSLSLFAMHAGSEKAARIYRLIRLPFYLLYTVARGVVAPMLAWHLSRFYLAGNADDVIPRWLVQSWMGVVILAILGSMLWVFDLWVEFFRAYRKKKTFKSD